MSTLLIHHPCFLEHDTGPGHPERADRMRAIDKVLAHELYKDLVRIEAPLREDVEQQILLAHPQEHLEHVRAAAAGRSGQAYLDPDTIVSPGTWQAVLRGVGAGLIAVDKVMAGEAK